MPQPADTVNLNPDHLDIVKQLLQKHIPHDTVWAFGSRVTENIKPYSDLDLVIVRDHPLSLELLAALAEDFSQSDLPFRVDIVDWATTHASFRKIIQQQFVVLQTCDTVFE